ncbi:MAG: YtxH domain-containing protein [Ornithinimicrobium sp.]|uniref:YtxH domain-containing protein n=1 Tax=Ornithinimicrobium sp. TaxID=1977084 RepID=UPI003D9B61E9
MRKLTLLTGVGIGYVLGAKAGRERYEQLADQASKVWADPRVQSKVEEVKEQAPQVAAKVGDSAKSAAGNARSKVSGHESTDGDYENATGSIDAEGQVTVDETGFGPGGERLP